MVNHQRSDVAHHAAHAGVAVRETGAAEGLGDVVDRLPRVEGVHEVRDRAHVQAHRAQAEQVVAEPHQFADDRADVLAARRDFDAQQFLDRHVPGHVVGHGRDIVHAVGDRHVLVEIEALADLLEARVQEADVGNGVRHPLAVQLQHQAQGGMGGRVLRTEIHRPQVRLPAIPRLVVGKFGKRQGHSGLGLVAGGPTNKIRNPNIEIRNNFKMRNRNDQNRFGPFCFGFWVCFGFRYSDFGFRHLFQLSPRFNTGKLCRSPSPCRG